MYKVFVNDKPVILTDAQWKVFIAGYTFIEAAGGLVKNAKGETLFIERLGRWDLPKGKIEKGENAKETAIREVEEECGIKGLSICGELIPTYHTYTRNNEKFLKRIHWFEMSCKGDEPLKPQAEEGITEVRWFGKNEMKIVLDNTYNSIRELVH